MEERRMSQPAATNLFANVSTDFSQFRFAEEMPYQDPWDKFPIDDSDILIDNEEELDQVTKEVDDLSVKIKAIEEKMKHDMRKRMFKTVLQGEVYPAPSRERKEKK